MRIVFAGTPEPALPSLRRLIDSPRHDVIAVLTRPDAAAGRRGKPAPSPVAALAIDAGILAHDVLDGFDDGGEVGHGWQNLSKKWL